MTETWEENGRKFTEICRQDYSGNDAFFAAGAIEGDAVERVYLQWGKDGQPERMLMLRLDELAAIAWVANGALWSVTLADLD